MSVPAPPYVPAGEADDAAAPDDPRPGTALCLSGGGYRAMVFHAGVLWRLNDAGFLARLDRVSSVSGGSITAGVLGLRWTALTFGGDSVATNLVDQVVRPIRSLAGRTVDVGSILRGAINPCATAAEKVAAAYRKHVFGDATLQDLPDRPRFVINATNVQSGALWRFSKPYMRDYRVGEVRNPTVPLAVAVGASSAFPPFLSPVRLRLREGDFTPGSGAGLQRRPFTTRPVLTDGGVYDNLGLETAWKRYRTILVSDAGGQMAAQGRPKRDWPRHVRRVLDVVDNQVRNLRKRQLIDSFVAGDREGAYCGIRTDIRDYGLADAFDCPYERTIALAETPTRLARMPDALQERLINWGYAVCDAALRTHVDKRLSKPRALPYPDAGV